MFRKMKHPKRYSSRTLAYTHSLDSERIILPAAREKVNDGFAALRHAFIALSLNHDKVHVHQNTESYTCIPSMSEKF
ncbi:unnamed protein product [Lasius platythorax]|uniref:Uncharacterized protein n=1 Tax=Lasius platythorax TaxID=488582 RepID=A0AAV2N4W5_9HYME